MAEVSDAILLDFVSLIFSKLRPISRSIKIVYSGPFMDQTNHDKIIYKIVTSGPDSEIMELSKSKMKTMRAEYIVRYIYAKIHEAEQALELLDDSTV